MKTLKLVVEDEVASKIEDEVIMMRPKKGDYYLSSLGNVERCAFDWPIGAKLFVVKLKEKPEVKLAKLVMARVVMDVGESSEMVRLSQQILENAEKKGQ